MPVAILMTIVVLLGVIALSGREMYTIIQHEEEMYYCGICGKMMPMSHFPH